MSTEERQYDENGFPLPTTEERLKAGYRTPNPNRYIPEDLIPPRPAGLTRLIEECAKRGYKVTPCPKGFYTPDADDVFIPAPDGTQLFDPNEKIGESACDAINNSFVPKTLEITLKPSDLAINNENVNEIRKYLKKPDHLVKTASIWSGILGFSHENRGKTKLHHLFWIEPFNIFGQPGLLQMITIGKVDAVDAADHPCDYRAQLSALEDTIHDELQPIVEHLREAKRLLEQAKENEPPTMLREIEPADCGADCGAECSKLAWEDSWEDSSEDSSSEDSSEEDDTFRDIAIESRALLSRFCHLVYVRTRRFFFRPSEDEIEHAM